MSVTAIADVERTQLELSNVDSKSCNRQCWFCWFPSHYRLMEAGEVICLDNYLTGKINIDQWIGNPRFELIRHDVTEPTARGGPHLSCLPRFANALSVRPIKTAKTSFWDLQRWQAACWCSPAVSQHLRGLRCSGTTHSPRAIAVASIRLGFAVVTTKESVLLRRYVSTISECMEQRFV